MRSLMLRSLTIGGLHLSEMAGQTSEGSVDLTAVVTADGVTDLMFEAAVTRIAAEPGLTRLRWSVAEDA